MRKYDTAHFFADFNRSKFHHDYINVGIINEYRAIGHTLTYQCTNFKLYMKRFYLILLAFVASIAGSFAQPQSLYCDTLVQHLGIPGEVASAVFVTIENTSASTMKITVRSNTVDSVDGIIIPGGSGGVPSAID
jgi:hypothetical protein